MKKKWVNIVCILIFVFSLASFISLFDEVIYFGKTYIEMKNSSQNGTTVMKMMLSSFAENTFVLISLFIILVLCVLFLIAFNKTEIKAMASSVQEIKEKRAQIKAEKQEKKRQKKMQALQDKMEKLEKDGK